MDQSEIAFADADNANYTIHPDDVDFLEEADETEARFNIHAYLHHKSGRVYALSRAQSMLFPKNLWK